MWTQFNFNFNIARGHDVYAVMPYLVFEVLPGIALHLKNTPSADQLCDFSPPPTKLRLIQYVGVKSQLLYGFNMML